MGARTALKAQMVCRRLDRRAENLARTTSKALSATNILVWKTSLGQMNLAEAKAHPSELVARA